MDEFGAVGVRAAGGGCRVGGGYDQRDQRGEKGENVHLDGRRVAYGLGGLDGLMGFCRFPESESRGDRVDRRGKRTWVICGLWRVSEKRRCEVRVFDAVPSE